MGNKTFVLPLGYVCDKCNNYFARKVEKPFLDLMPIKLLRFQELIPGKRNNIPMISGIFNRNYPVKMKRKIMSDEVINEVEISSELIDKIFNNEFDRIEVISAFTNETIFECNCTISRFLAKMALEALADRVKGVTNSLGDLVNDYQFDLIRNHARLGTTPEWPCNVRRIYEYDKIWDYDDGYRGQTLYENDFLFINVDDPEFQSNEQVYAGLYFIIALCGMEFAINMGDQKLKVNKIWLEEHYGVSPLYFGKNEPKVK